MREFAIMTDSCCDLTAAMAEELSVLPLSLHMGEAVYRNWLDGRDIGFPEFYSRVRGGESASTAAVSVGDFEAEMRRILASGRDILCVNFSSALCASLGQGLLVWLCARERKKGRTLEEVRDFAEETRRRICHWFTVDDLNHLKRGGRISAATALFGTMLSIKPVMHVDDGGHLTPVGKARGRKASLLALVDEMEKTAIDPGEQTVFISHGDCLADAEFVAEEVRRRFGTKDIHINYVGPVIGSHSGPGTVALFFLGTVR